MRFYFRYRHSIVREHIYIREYRIWVSFDMFCICKNSRVAQGCLLDNQAKFVIIYHKSTNHLKKFIGKDISRFKKLLLDYKYIQIILKTLK